ncbi:MAG: class I SAM-dependent methyltransferase [Nanoarchaeota archaeon]|nr:class I SAM-dependent methyltransferase [Nanoarchaeota archaeon]
MPDKNFKRETENFFDNYHNENLTLSNLTELDKYLMKNYFLNISEFLFDKIKYHSNISKNSKILDIGCGSGEYLIFLSNSFRKGKYYGVDISKLAIDQANKNLMKNKFNFFGDPFFRGFAYNVNAENFKFSKVNGTDFLFQGSYFDIIYFVMVLHHTYEYERLIKEAYRMLKNDGLLIIVDLKGQSELIKMFIKFVFLVTPKFLIKKIFKNDLVLEDGKIPFRSDVLFSKIKRIVDKIDGFKIIESQTRYLLVGYFTLFFNLFYNELLFRILKPFFYLIINIDRRLSRTFKNSCDCFAIVIKKIK